MTARLTFAVPTFQRAELLRATLERLAAQIGNRRDVEIAVSDNASADLTPEVVAALQQRFPYIRYARQSENVGPDLNICRVMELASGRHVWLFGDDDLLLPGALNRVLGVLDSHPDVSIVFANWWARAPFRSDRLVRGGDEFLRTVRVAPVFLSSLVIRRDLWLAHDCAPYVGSRFMHYYVVHAIMRSGTAFCIRQQLVCTLPTSVDDHWTRGPNQWQIGYGNIARALGFLPRFGYDPRAVRRAYKGHFRALPRSILVMKAQGIFGIAEAEGLKALRPMFRGLPVTWAAARMAEHVPSSWAARALATWRRLRGADQPG